MMSLSAGDCRQEESTIDVVEVTGEARFSGEFSLGKRALSLLEDFCASRKSRFCEAVRAKSQFLLLLRLIS